MTKKSANKKGRLRTQPEAQSSAPASSKVMRADFLLSAPRVELLPPSDCFEVAIVGRSNVGKSSFINRVCERRKLARTSSTPGSTQHIVMFDVEIQTPESVRLSLRLVDLPGFGYAQRSKAERKGLSATIKGYVTKREGLSLLCVLSDIRRDPEEEELALAAHAYERDIPYLIIATKVDKLTRTELAKRSHALALAYGLDAADLVLTGEGISTESFWRRLALLCC